MFQRNTEAYVLHTILSVERNSLIQPTRNAAPIKLDLFYIREIIVLIVDL